MECKNTFISTNVFNLIKKSLFLVNVLYQIHVVYYIYKKQPCKQVCFLNGVTEV